MPETTRDPYPDALRALALIVVVFGHWIATLPRLDEGLMVDADHLLKVWPNAGILTWLVQVVPLFVFVSAAVSSDGVARRLQTGGQQLHWWAGRALSLARPTVTYMASIAALTLIAIYTGGRLLGPLDQSLTLHLWFLVMLLIVQALLPLSWRADHRFGLGVVLGLILLAGLIDLIRAAPATLDQLLNLGTRASADTTGIGWVNALVVWLIPQQLGIAWKQRRFRGSLAGLALIMLGLVWLSASVASGYSMAMVGIDFEGRSNMLPPTLALIGVMWLQVGAVLLFERPARWLLERKPIGRSVAILGALGMPLYLWHKLAELPAAWLGERLRLPIDAGIPGEPGFWVGRLWWLALCILMVVPVIAAVVSFELHRKRDVPATRSTPAIIAGGFALLAGLIVALVLGATPGSLIGLIGVVAASWLLRQRQAKPDDSVHRWKV